MAFYFSEDLLIVVFDVNFLL